MADTTIRYDGWDISVVDGLGALWGDSTGCDVEASERTWGELMENWLHQTYPGATIRYRAERNDLDSRIYVSRPDGTFNDSEVEAIQEHMQDLYGSGNWVVLSK